MSDLPPTDPDVIDELGLARYRKTITALAGVVALIATATLAPVWAAVVVGALVVFGVYRVPNA